MDKIVDKLHSPALSLVKTLGSTIIEATITDFRLAHIFEMWSYLEVKHVWSLLIPMFYHPSISEQINGTIKK